MVHVSDPADSRSRTRQTVLVTGGAGYVGVPLVDELQRSGRDVRVLDVLLHGQEGVAARLRERGVARVHDSGLCTRCDGSSFHSYRRDGKRGGRNLAVLTKSR